MCYAFLIYIFFEQLNLDYSLHCKKMLDKKITLLRLSITLCNKTYLMSSTIWKMTSIQPVRDSIYFKQLLKTVCEQCNA